MPSTVFYECIDKRLLSGAIGDLVQCIAAFPLSELKKLPDFSLQDYNNNQPKER